MLNAMRNNRKFLAIVLWLVIIAFVSTIFVVWGIGSRENYGSYVAKVDGDTIGYEEYRNFYDNSIQSIRQLLGASFDEYAKNVDLEQNILNDMINRKLLLIEAQKMGVPASDYEIIEMIKSIPSFQTNGVFDPKQYTQVLSYNRQTPAVFENALREDLLIEKLRNIVRNSQSQVTEEAAMGEFNYRGSTAEVNYFSVPVSNFIPKTAPAEDLLNAYYEANKEKYRTEVQIKLKYVTFSKDGASSAVTVSNEEVEKYYVENSASFLQPASVTLRSIFIPVENWNDQAKTAEAKKKADEAYKQLKDGKMTFVQAYNKYSDKRFTNAGGLIGKVTRNNLLPEVAEIAFTLEPKGISEIIKTDAGYQIISVDEQNAAKTPTLDEMRAQITEKIKSDKLASAYRSYVLSIYRDILKAGNITAYNAANPEKTVKTEETELFSMNNGVMPVFLTDAKVLNGLFSLGKTELSQLVEEGDHTYLFEITEKVPSAIPALKDVEAKVIADYNDAEARKEGAATVKAALEKDGFEKTAAAYKAKVEKTPEFRRSEPAGVFIFDKALVDDIFKAKSGTVLPNGYVIGSSVYAVKVGAVIPPSSDNYAKEKDAIVAYISTVKQEEALSSFIASLREKAKVEINPAFISNKAAK